VEENKMDYEQASDIVRQLADGLDPSTGEPLTGNGPYQQPQVIRALYLANRALARQDELLQRQKGRPENSGQPWSDDEDLLLVEGFEAETPLKELASRHERTVLAVEARLAKLGKIPGTKTRYRV
jgi:hypothetical protein